MSYGSLGSPEETESATIEVVQPIPTIPTTPTDGTGETNLKPDTSHTPNGLSPSKVLFSSAEDVYKIHYQLFIATAIRI